MLLIFADDSSQRLPSRGGMDAPLFAAGALLIDGDATGSAESGIQELCLEYGFPAEQEFKWSPGSELWMHDNLFSEARENFFLGVIALLRRSECKAMIVVLDSSFSPVTSRAPVPTCLDAFRFLILRLGIWLQNTDEYGMIVMDQPGGSSVQQREFAENCARYWADAGAIASRRIVIAPLPANSGSVRLLQAADLVTGCSLAYVSGELNYSPPVFAAMRSLLCIHDGRIGQHGLVISPSFKYANLYAWLLRDSSYRRGHLVAPLPLPTRPYSTGDWSL